MSKLSEGEQIFKTIQTVLIRNLGVDGKVRGITQVSHMQYLAYDAPNKTLAIQKPAYANDPSPVLTKRMFEIVADNNLPVREFKFIPCSPNGTGKSSHEPQSEIVLTPYSEIAPEHLDYIWPSYLARNKLHHFAGNSTEGKSPVATDLIACVTNPAVRKKWPDDTPNDNQPQSVLLLSAEDDPNDTVRPRLAVAKADAGRVYNVGCSVEIDQKPVEKLLALDRDIRALIAKAKALGDVGLIVVDPITNYLGKAGMNKEEDVRGVLMQLVDAARSLHLAVVTIGHLNRREKGTDPMHRIMGAAAFAGVARFVYLFGPDEEDADQYAHVMVQRRGVGASALRYRTVAESKKWNGKTSGVIRVLWRGKSQATAESIVDPVSPEKKSQIGEAAKALKVYLSDGPKPAKECMDHLKEKGFDVDDLNRSRVLKKASARSEKLEGNRFYSWFLEDQSM